MHCDIHQCLCHIPRFVKVHVEFQHPLMFMSHCDFHQSSHYIVTYINGYVSIWWMTLSLGNGSLSKHMVDNGWPWLNMVERVWLWLIMVELFDHRWLWLNYVELLCSSICYVTYATLINGYVEFQYSARVCWITIFHTRHVSLCHIVAFILVGISWNTMQPNGYYTFL